jgi:hypothetical protein
MVRVKEVQGVPDAVCSECSLIFAHPALAGCCSFQMITFPSYEHDARIWPNFGWAQATCHTGPVCLVGKSCMSGERDRSIRGKYVIPFQRLTCAALGLVIYDIKDFDSTVRGARCEALAVVIQLRVVLRDGCHFQ